MYQTCFLSVDVFSSHSKEGGLKGKAKFDLDEVSDTIRNEGRQVKTKQQVVKCPKIHVKMKYIIWTCLKRLNCMKSWNKWNNNNRNIYIAQNW